MTLTIEQFERLCGSSSHKNNIITPTATIGTILTDSRSLIVRPSGCIFFALSTASRDGHAYIYDLYRKGVRSFVVSRTPKGITSMQDANIIYAHDVSQALVSVATYVRQQISCPVIGITGSRGKTIVKEMINAALAHHHKVTRSPRSWNSQIGVPKSLCLLDDSTDIAIIEAGISQKGEMSALASMIRPTIGVFTALTDEHAEGFDSIRQKASEKASLFIGCSAVFYPKNQTLIEDALRDVLQPTSLRPIDGGNNEIAKAVALYLDPNANVECNDTNSSISARIDITEADETTSVAYDNYTCDLYGIETALDYVCRRISSERHIVAFISDLICNEREREKTYQHLHDTLIAAGVTTLYADGTEIAQFIGDFNDIKVVAADTTQNLAQKLIDSPHHNTTYYINTTDKKSSAILRDRLCALRHITRLNIDLEALVSNYKYYKSQIPADVRMVAMIKASAYGCGAVEVARTLQASGIDYFAVAVVDEGAALRKAGVDTPVIILDPWCTDPRAIVANKLEPTLIAPNIELFHALDNAAAEAGVDIINVHVKLDTGMHRLGLSQDQLEPFASLLKQFQRFNVVSMFSHLATADCLDQDAYTRMQLENFDRMSDELETLLNNGSPNPRHIYRHILNTAGITRYGQTDHHDMVRLGIGLYGISPLDNDDNLKPVATLTTTVIAVTPHPTGATIGYGRRGVLTRPSLIATLPIGYADGLNRHLSCGNASFLINGVLCPTVGNICMDLCMVDVTDCPNCKVGTSVEIFGTHLPIQRLSDALDTIPYEVLTSVSPRVKRIYFRD